MASFTDVKREIIPSQAIKQGMSRQDFAKHGKTVTEKNTFLVVCDGHGSSQTIDYLRCVDWETILEDPDFIQKLMLGINKTTAGVGKRNDGSTLSVVTIIEDSLHCYWVGDSSIKIFEDGKLVFISKNHDRYNRAEIKRISENCNMRGIERENIWDIELVDDKNIKSVPAALFDFGAGHRINMTHALGHEGRTGSHIGYTNFLATDPTKTYKVVVASDGFWDMTYPGDNDYIGHSDNEAKELVAFADSRWRQEWIHDNTLRRIPGVKFPEQNIDDIAVATALIKPLIL